MEALALDIPLNQPEKSRFQALWRDVSWQRWELLPGVNHFSGALSGGVENGRLTLRLAGSTCLTAICSVRRLKSAARAR